MGMEGKWVEEVSCRAKDGTVTQLTATEDGRKGARETWAGWTGISLGYRARDHNRGINSRRGHKWPGPGSCLLISRGYNHVRLPQQTREREQSR